MNTLRLRAAAIAAAFLAIAPLSQAHNAWLLPSGTVFSKADTVSVDAAVSNDLFVANHAPLRLEGLQINAPDGSAPMPQLAPGSYKLVVEAAREVGGREVVSIPFQWPPTSASQPSASGKEELGEIKLELKP